MAAPVCLECGSVILDDDELREGQQITCPKCGARFEVISLEPLELDWFYSEPSSVQDDV